MIEDVDPYDSPLLATLGRGGEVGRGLLFIMSQCLNLEYGTLRTEIRPLRENHQLVIDIDARGQRTATFDGMALVLTKPALNAYRARYNSNKALPHTIVTHLELLDASAYRTFIERLRNT